MATSIALLRSINVGKRRVRMPDLVEMFVAAGCTDVRTYVQSGNVVFSHPSRSEKSLRADLEARLVDGCGFEVRVVLRTRAEMSSIVERNPYPRREATKVHVSFLVDAPAVAAADAIDRPAFEPEAFTVDGREIYLDLPDGMGRSVLAPVLGRSLLRSPATTRNWRTVEALLEMVSV